MHVVAYLMVTGGILGAMVSDPCNMLHEVGIVTMGIAGIANAVALIMNPKPPSKGSRQ